MTKKNLFKRILTSLAVCTACLLIAAAPISPLPGSETPEETTAESTGETEPGYKPLNDDETSQEKKK